MSDGIARVDMAPRSADAPPPREVTGFVEEVNERSVQGWVDCASRVDLMLVVDGTPMVVQPADLVRVDAVNEGFLGARGFRFYIAACKLAPGRHLVEVFPIVDGARCQALRGVGVAHAIFDLDIAAAAFPSPSMVEFLIKNHAMRPEIRRCLVADPGIRFRPETWAGDVIFVDGLPGPHTIRYRINNLVEEMLALGYDCCVLTSDELWRIEAGDYTARVVQFVRCPLSDVYASAAAAARRTGARIGFDIDDLAFDPGLMPYIDGLRALSQTKIEEYQAGMLHYRAFLREADFVTVPTVTLRDAASAVSANVHVVVNSISREVGAVAYGQTPRDPRVVRIGYYSGTNTHQADFGVAASALIETLHAHPCARLRVAGHLDLSEFAGFAAVDAQVERVAEMPYPDMLRNMAECDVVIAPLELDNPFCEAKSELKFFEGVLTGCAVVASPTGPFRGAITNGETGYLPATPRDWRDALTALIRDPEHRRDMNQAARERVLDRYAARNAAASFMAAAGLIEPPANEIRLRGPLPVPHRPGTPLNIGFVLPAITVGSGGLRKVLRICYDLERFGHRVCLYVMGNANAGDSRAAIRRHYYPFAGQVFRYNGTVGTHDTLVATAWETAYVVRRHCPDPSRAAYFVQDFEPMFMPVGTGYLKALATYSFGFRVIAFGAWIAARLRHDLGLASSVIRFPLNHQAYFPAAEPARKGKSVLLFARPSQERRAYDLAVGALAIVARRLRDVQIGFYGEDSYGPVPFEYTNHGLITSEMALGDLYRSTTVGICLSPTNPSMVAYEMIACGAALVDLRLPGAEVNFDGMDVPYLAVPTEQTLADAIIAAVTDDAGRAGHVAAGLRYAATMDHEESVAVMFERHILGSPAEPAAEAPAPPVLATLNGAALPSARLRRRQVAAEATG